MLEDLGKPKTTINSAYNLFYKENFSSVHKKGDPVAGTIKRLSETWNSLSEAQKDPYILRHKKAKEEYDEALKAWKEKIGANEESAENIQMLNSKINRKRKLKKRKQSIEE